MPTCHPLAGEPDYEKLWTCPYNASHRVAHKRIQFHLTKCRKCHPNAKKEVCPYNATHMVNEQEFQYHLETCVSKGIVDNFRYVTPNENHVIELPPAPELPPPEENWDNDYCETYEPAARVAEAPIIYSFIGGTKSERKKRRVEQRQKFRALDESVPTIKVKAEPTPVVENEYKPLRQPTSLLENLRNNSGAFASLNRFKAAAAANAAAATAAESTPKPQGVARVLNKPCTAESDLFTRRNGAAGVARSENRPGSSQDSDDDGFITFKSKGRGAFRN